MQTLHLQTREEVSSAYSLVVSLPRFTYHLHNTFVKHKLSLLLVRQFSTAIGPVIGGVVAGTLGFRYIFWLLTLMGSITLIMLFVFFPETLRAMTGNGSIPLKGWQYVPLVKTLAPWEKSTAIRTEKDELPPREKMTPSMFLQPMLFLLEKDVACTLFYGAVIYSVFSMVSLSGNFGLDWTWKPLWKLFLTHYPQVSASTSVLLAREFNLSTLQYVILHCHVPVCSALTHLHRIGLCFLPNGIGCVVGATISGRQLDKDFRLAETQYKYEHDLPRHYRLPKGNQPADFPLETTRLAQVPTMTAAFCFAVVIYGFGIANGGSLVIPLAAQFVIGYSSTAVLNLNNTLTVDLYPGKSAAATAVNNLARCLVGALGVSLTDMALEKMPAEYFFVVLAGCVLLATPMAWAEAKYGIQWRSQRMKKIQEKKESALASHA